MNIPENTCTAKPNTSVFSLSKVNLFHRSSLINIMMILCHSRKPNHYAGVTAREMNGTVEASVKILLSKPELGFLILCWSQIFAMGLEEYELSRMFHTPVKRIRAEKSLLSASIALPPSAVITLVT